MTLRRALARGLGYPLVAVAAVAVLPITVAVAVATNYRGTAERLGGVPGVRADGGVSSGLVVGVVLVTLAAAIGIVGVLAMGGSPGGLLDWGDGTSPAAPDATPTPNATEMPTVTPTETSDLTPREQRALFCSTYVRVLENESNISVTYSQIVDDGCQIKYVEQPPVNRSQVSKNVGLVSRAYTEGIRQLNGTKPERLEVMVADTSGSVRFTYYIRTSWSQKNIEGELSDRETVEKIRGTIELNETNN